MRDLRVHVHVYCGGIVGVDPLLSINSHYRLLGKNLHLCTNVFKSLSTVSILSGVQMGLTLSRYVANAKKDSMQSTSTFNCSVWLTEI